MRLSTLLIILTVVICSLDVFIANMPQLLRKRGVELRWHTRFGPALVFDSEADGTEVRLLNVRGTFQSIAYTDPARRDELVCLYHQYFAQAVEPVALGRALVLGCGGYSFPRWLLAERPGCVVDAVEIDPAITRLAEQYFWMDDVEAAHGGMGAWEDVSSEDDGTRHGWKERLSGDGLLREVEGDAWDYLLGARASDVAAPDCNSSTRDGQRDAGEKPDTAHKTWDLIVNDAFAKNRPLGQMETREGVRLIHEHLTPGGVYCANVISALEGRKSRTLEEVKDTLCAQFRHVYLFPERPEEPGKRGNNAVVASDTDLHIREEFSLHTTR